MLQREKNEYWRSEIGSAIKASEVMIWIVAEDDGTMSARHCFQELFLALGWNKIVLPLRALQEATPPPAVWEALKHSGCAPVMDFSAAKVAPRVDTGWNTKPHTFLCMYMRGTLGSALRAYCTHTGENMPKMMLCNLIC